MQTFIPFLSRRVYDFSSSVSFTTNVVVVRALEVVRWRVGQLVVRVHAVNITPPGAMFVEAFMISPSSDAPQTDFVATSTAASASIGSASAGSLVIDPFRNPFGGHLQLRVRAIAGSGGAGTPLRATLSAALFLRERP